MIDLKGFTLFNAFPADKAQRIALAFLEEEQGIKLITREGRKCREIRSLYKMGEINTPVEIWLKDPETSEFMGFDD